MVKREDMVCMLGRYITSRYSLSVQISWEVYVGEDVMSEMYSRQDREVS